MNTIKKILFPLIFTFIVFLTFQKIEAAGGSSPVLTLIGPSEVYYEIGTPYYEYGATAIDAEDGDLTGSIVINSSTVNTNVVGNYVVTYTITDIDSNVSMISRVIKTGAIQNNDLINDYAFYTNSFSESYNFYTNVLALPSNAFASVGRAYTSESCSWYGCYAYFSPLLNIIDGSNEISYNNTSNVYSSTSYWRDSIVNSIGEIVTVGGTNDTRAIIGIFTDSSIKSSNYSNYTSNFTKITEISNNKYAIFDSYNHYIYIYNGTTYENRFSIGYEVTSLISNFDNTIITAYNNGTNTILRKHAINGTIIWEKTLLNTTISKLFNVNNSIVAVGNTTNTTNNEISKTNGASDGIIIKLDFNSNIQFSKVFGGTNNDFFNLSAINDNYMVLTYNSSSENGILDRTDKGIILINTTDFSIAGKTKHDYVFNINSIAINSTGMIALAGGFGTGNAARSRLVQISPIYSLGFEDKNVVYGTSFDPSLDTHYIDASGNDLNMSINSIDGSVNTTIVGNHTIYYNISVLTDDGFKHMRIKRIITVEPISNINNLDVFDGSVPLNIQGGSIQINGNPYISGTNYAIPGNSSMVITGINGYSKTINFTLNLVHSGIIEGYTYAEPVALTFSGGSATLNGNLYISGTSISNKGNHTIIITGANGFSKTISFSMVPTVLNVANNEVYYETVEPNINAETMTLNGVAYNNEPITNAGNYNLVITGVGGYTQTISFVIETVVTGIENSGIYDGSADVEFTKGSAQVNGISILSGDTIYNPGNNTLTITGENGYSRSWTFTINLVTSGITNGAVYKPEMTPNFSGGTLSLNGNAFTSGTLVNTPGLYTLIVSGQTGFTRTYYFTIEPELINVTAGSVYIEPRVVAISNGTVTLNGSPYVSNTVLNQSGNYTLQITGAGGYFRSIQFTMSGGSNVIDLASYVATHTIYFIGSATLNGSPISSGHVVDDIGNYSFELIDGLYTESKTFSIVPNTSIYNEDIFLSHIIDIENAVLSLDGNPISNLYEITAVGNYSLTVSGINGYSLIIPISVLPEVNIIDETTYFDTKQLITTGGSATLNGTAFDGDEVLTTIGKYTLTITGEGGYSKSWDFYVAPTIIGLEEGGLYIDSVTPVIDYEYLELDGISYISDTIIDIEGFHILTITGINGYQLDISFVIVTSDLGIAEGETYVQYVSVESSIFTMVLNGSPYSSGTSITTLGKNTLVLSSGSDSKSIEFYIIPLINNVEDGGTYIGSVTPIINHNNLLLNSAIYSSGTTINTIGNHILKVVNIGSGATLYTFEISFTVTENPVNLSNDGEYVASVTPNIANAQSLKLDGLNYTNNTLINAVGYHTISIYGVNNYVSSIEFTILPSISNVVNDGVYSSSINAVIPNATLLLNGQSYTNGNIINQVGYHELIINGTNGYQQTLNFTINPNIQNVVNGGVYTTATPKTPVVNYAVKLELNGQPFTSGTQITQVGYYELKVYGTNDYVYSISFEFNYVMTGITNGSVYTGSARPVISNAILELNGNSYTSNTVIYTVGHHILTIKGQGNYEKEVTFTILPSISGVTNQSIYTSNITITVNYVQQMTLNGENFISGSIVSTLGHYELVINGVNEYTQTITFTRDYATLSVTQNGVYTNAVTINLNNSTGLTLNGVDYVSGTSISTIGNYELIINGNGNYQKSINFMIDHGTLNVSNDTAYTTARTITVSNATSLELNGTPFVSGTVVSTLGNYELSIFGVGNYQKTVSFEINPPVLTVTNNSNYTVSKTITVNNATMLELNGTEYISGTVVSRIGNYRLDIYGEGEYHKTINFVINPPSVNIQNTIYTSSVTPNIPNATLTLNGTEISNLTTIFLVGNYEFIITGEGGWISTYNFEISPSISGVIDDTSYSSQVIPNIPNATLLLNGEVYTNLTPISYIGNYEITIKGEGLYESTIIFEIVPTIAGANHNQSYDGSVTIDVTYQYPNNSDPYQIFVNNLPYELESPYNTVGNHQLLIKGVNGYEYTRNFIIKEVPNGLIDDNQYQGSTIITIPNATLQLNGEIFVSGTLIDSVGHHILTVTGQSGYQNVYEFTILEVVENIVSNGIYNYQATPIVKNATLSLNGSPFISGTTIKTVGNHELTVHGMNGYTNTYHFTITETIFGLTDDMISETPVTLVFDDINELFVNGVIKTSPVSVNQVGNYVVVVKGNDGYTSEYQFTISLDTDNIVNDGVYTGYANPVFNSSNILLNGQPYSSGSPIVTVGYHTIIIFGEGGYEKTMSFTVEPTVTGVVDGAVYNSNVKPNILNLQSITLNGESFTNNSTIQNAGHYQLELYGLNGYYQSISFTIQDDIVITYLESANGIYYGWVNIATNNSQFNISSDDETHQTLKIVTIGYYQVTIHGEGNYQRVIDVELDHKILNKNETGTYTGAYTPIIEGEASLYLNDELYLEETEINMAGNHTLTIVGWNNYSKDYVFTIEPIVIIDEMDYNKKITASNHLSAMIDGVLVDLENPHTHTVIGHHVLRINGVNGWTNTYNFTIEADVTIPEISDDPYIVTVANTPKSIYVNNMIYRGTEISTAGNHIIVINGTNGYSITKTLQITAKIEGLKDGDIFDGSASFSQSNGSVYISGRLVSANQLFREVGYHFVVIRGVNGYQSEPFTITINPIITGILHESEYVGEANYIINNSKGIYINDVLANPQGTIDIVGKHSIEVKGENDYSQMIEITVHPDIEHLNDNTELYSALSINNAEKVMLNGIEVNGNYILSNYGNYVLLIEGANNYSFEMNFVVPVTFIIPENSVYIEEASLHILNLNVKIDGLIPSSEIVSQVGYHTIEYFGEGDYYVLRNFVINEKLSILNSNHYNGYVLLQLPANANYLFNGEPVSSGVFRPTLIGHHTLTVLGRNGYESIYEFYIDPVLNISEGETITSIKKIEKINATMILNGKVVTEDTDNFKHGKNTLVIKGTGDYEDVEITFYYTNKHVENTIYIGIPVAVISLGAIVWFLLRRKKVI